MRLVRLKFQGPDPEICRQLRLVSSRLKLVPILRTTVQFFSEKYLQGRIIHEAGEAEVPPPLFAFVV